MRSKHISKPEGLYQAFVRNEPLAGGQLSFWTTMTRPGVLLCGELPSTL